MPKTHLNSSHDWGQVPLEFIFDAYSKYMHDGPAKYVTVAEIESVQKSYMAGRQDKNRCQ